MPIIIIADPTSAVLVAAPFVNVRVATGRFGMRSTSNDEPAARRRYQAGAVGSTQRLHLNIALRRLPTQPGLNPHH